MLARSLNVTGKLLTRSVLAVYEAAAQPLKYRRLPSSKFPSQVPCSPRMSHQRSGGGGWPGTNGAGTVGGGTENGAGTMIGSGEGPSLPGAAPGGAVFSRGWVACVKTISVGEVGATVEYGKSEGAWHDGLFPAVGRDWEGCGVSSFPGSDCPFAGGASINHKSRLPHKAAILGGVEVKSLVRPFDRARGMIGCCMSNEGELLTRPGAMVTSVRLSGKSFQEFFHAHSPRPRQLQSISHRSLLKIVKTIRLI
jgi:hypothetical protein